MFSLLRTPCNTGLKRIRLSLRTAAALILALALLLSFAGCASQTDPESLAHKWDTTELIGAENAGNTLSYFGFSEEELAFADLASFGLVKSVEFTESGSFRFFYDKDATKAFFESYINELIAKLYENKDALSELFGEELGAEATLVGFETAYAAQYDFKSYGEYLEYVVDELFVSFDLENNLIEQGSFSLSGDKIELKAENAARSEHIGYSLSGEKLTIIYSDAKEVYTRAK